MAKLKRSMIAALAVLGLFPASGAMASLSLVLSDNDATPSSTIVARGGSFTVSVKVISTSSVSADSFVGASYQLQGPVLSPPIGNVFTLLDRNQTGITASNIIQYNNDNTVVLDNTSGSGFAARLNPTNGSDPGTGDLGGSFSNIRLPIRNTDPNGATIAGASNSLPIANYQILVAANTPAGVYHLTIAPLQVSIYDSASDTAPDGTLSNAPATSQIQNDFAVTVTVPEPSSFLLVGMGASVLGLRRRRR